MEKIVWHLVTGIVCTLLGWGLANFVSIDTDGVRVTGLRERVEVWRLTREIRRLEREVERLKRRPLRDEQHNSPGEPLAVAQP